MNLPAKTEYACLAVLELATWYGTDEPVRARAIAERQGIPSPFLVQILLQLKCAGIVESTRGAAGGYRLVRDPAQLSLGEVVAIVEGGSGDFDSNATRQTPATRVLLQAWSEADMARRQALAELTFADLLERVRHRSESMYYI
ncbi:MAG: Rrf2 family transcriptional regulator [Pirellulales bacterium]